MNDADTFAGSLNVSCRLPHLSFACVPSKARPLTICSTGLLGAAGTASLTMVCAAATYFSMSMGDMVSASPMLSKPKPVSSGRKFMVGVVVDTEQVVHRVAVFHAIEAAHRHAARIGIARVDAEHAVLDPALELGLFGGGEAGLLFRRHEAGARVVEHAQATDPAAGSARRFPARRRPPCPCRSRRRDTRSNASRGWAR